MEIVGNTTDQSISSQAQILAIIACVIFIVLVVHLIRNNRIKPGHAIIWIMFGAGLLLVSVFTGLLNIISFIIGIYYPPAAFFIIILGALILVSIHFSVIVSRLERQVIELTQELGLYKHEVYGKQIKRKLQKSKKYSKKKIDLS